MIISVDKDGAVSLLDADNFKGFKVSSAMSDKAKLGQALASAGRYDGEHAWISRSWLVAQGKAHGPAWQAEFDKMMAYAQSKGWVEADAIRAHVEMD